jgi:hypothetical protein
MNKKHTLPLTLILLALLTSGCLRLATSPTVDLTQFTPQASASPPGEMTPPAVPAATATPALDAASQNVLRLFPLWVGSTWVYDYLGYTPDQEVHWRLTETVTSSSMLDGNYVVEVERQAELTLGDPSQNFPFQPPTGSYYYVIDGEQVYKYEGRSPTDLTDAWLELVLPFPPEGELWYPNPADRAASEPPEIGGRTADGPYEQAVSESGTHTCYNVKTEVAEGVQEMSFCDGIGIVFSESKSFEGEGYRMEMIGFVLQ